MYEKLEQRIISSIKPHNIEKEITFEFADKQRFQ